MLLAVEEPCVI